MKYLVPAAALIALLALVGCNQAPAESSPPPRPVKTVVAGHLDTGKEWSFSGTAEDAQETPLSFRVSGKIIAFPGDQIGRRFNEGDTIARLDPSDYELEVRQANANLQQVRANYVRSKADAERNRQLFSRKVISKSEMDQAEAEFRSYEAQLNASAKQLDIARKQLNYTTLEAPFDGWIGSVVANKHQNVQSGEAVVSFNAGQQMKMYVSVPDTLIGNVREGDKVEVGFDALPGRNFEGKVMEIGVGSSEGATYPVKVYLDNDDKSIRSGMTGHVRFEGHSGDATVVYLPAQSVRSKTDGTRAVWVVNPDTTTVHSRPVKLGELTAHGVAILDGVTPGETVVTHGVHHLKEGLKVRLMHTDSEG